MKNFILKTVVVLIALCKIVAAQESVSAINPTPSPSPNSSIITKRQIIELPVINRHFLPLLEIVPSVSSDLPDEPGFGLSNFTNISINGLRRSAVNYFVDGASITDVSSNINLIFSPSLESIQEMKVASSSISAEIGRSGGSVFITTRAEGNKFRGSLFEFVRNDKFNANSFFAIRWRLRQCDIRASDFYSIAA